MTEHEASRTLVKSPPELWAECSDAASLARHLGQFGEIRITRLEPETAVAWEGETASGTVRLEPSGWGTRVILTARQLGTGGTGAPNVPVSAEAAPTSEAAGAPDPASGPDPASDVSPADDVGPADEDRVAPEVDVTAEVAPATDPLPPAPRSRLLGRLFGFLRRAPAAPPTAATGASGATAAGLSAALEGAVEAPLPLETAVVEPPLTDATAASTALTLDAVGEEGRPGTAAAPDAIDSQAALDCALDSLGQAHHRPFSRA
jgi:hypothetical protein